jgi:signal transduction histidine kinase
MKIDRPALLYGYFGLVAGAIVALNIATFTYSAAHTDQVLVAIYLMACTLALAFVEVRLERGRLSLSGIAIGAAAILLNPLNATIVGLSIGVRLARRGSWHIAGNALTTGAATLGGATLASLLRTQGSLSVGSRFLVILAVNVATWALVAVGLSVRSGESISSIIRHNFTASFYIAHGYFALASLLVSYLLDGSLTGYVLATIVCVLALALTDTIAGRRMRRILESELSDADRHLFHSRAVEGVVHNLRNHIATTVGYLKEIEQRRLDPVDRDAVNMAAEAANDAVVVLRSLAQGATPKVSYAPEPTDLNELVTRALSMARPRARSKEIQLEVHEAPDDVRVKADPLLLREVITNLVNNAIDAAPKNGRVELRTGRRSNGWPYFSVVDNGPGVLDDDRHHLFEPHFTTKESGTGLGLFMSYGIVREHQGQLLYEGNRRGAVFTVVLPPFSG